MASIDHFMYGPITPILAYGLSVLGSFFGLGCAVRARAASTPARRAWYLLLAAWAIGGTGVWAMHFMAMLGFGVEDTEIRYDVPLTTASAIIAVTVVAVGLFTAALGRPRVSKTLLGGVFAGFGVAAMHYTGMAAMRLDGDIGYDLPLVAASVAIAVVAATTALWLAVTVRRPFSMVVSALVMGVAVCGMHYTGMLAMRVHVHATGDPRTGATGFALILPILLLVLLVTIGLVAALLAGPGQSEDTAPAAVTGGGAPAAPPAAPAAGRNGNRHSVSLAEVSGGVADGRRRLNGEAFSGVRRQSAARSNLPPPRG